MDLSTAPLDALTVEYGERPKAPPIPGVTDAQRSAGGHLALIHRTHIQDLAQIARLMGRIEAGDSPPAELADIVLATDMAHNLRVFGSLCGRECQVLTFHHNAEEGHMFPELEDKATDAIRAVVARLREEHKVVHELLTRLAAAATAMGYEPTDARFAEVRAIYQRLHDVIRSHFHYEETELEEAIGVYLNGI